MSTLHLPISGWVFEWRDDGFWRDLSREHWDAEQLGEFEPIEAFEWIAWPSPFLEGGFEERDEMAAGSSPGPTW